MASTYTGNLQGAGAAQQSMLGFGPAAGSPYFSGADQQRLQYYSSQPQHQAPAAPVSSDISGRRSGKVKFFDTQKGFGFINDYRPEDLGNEEIFVHYTSITAKSGFRSLAEGEEAEYEIVRGPKGFQAANVTGPGGQQVVGDSRTRNPKPAYMNMSPYTAMYPYMQQDPSSFYANSPYQPSMVMMPPTDYRAPQPMAQPVYRHSPHYSAVPSPYASPGPLRPFDISQDFANMGLGGLGVDEGLRSRSTAKSAPFGGMFGAVPNFDGASALPLPGSSVRPTNAPSYKATVPSMPSGLPQPAPSLGESSTNAASSAASSSRDRDATPAEKPMTSHSRSSSILYSSGSKPNTGSAAPKS